MTALDSVGAGSVDVTGWVQPRAWKDLRPGESIAFDGGVLNYYVCGEYYPATILACGTGFVTLEYGPTDGPIVTVETLSLLRRERKKHGRKRKQTRKKNKRRSH